MKIWALIFDFDGLIVDSEMPAFQSWQELYAEHGCTLPLSEWAAGLGGSGAEFDPCSYLEAQIGRAVDRAALRARRWQRKVELLAIQSTLPGVEAYLHDARKLGLRLGLASSSARAYVTEQLMRLGLLDQFDVIACGDEARQVKPHPELYLTVLAALEVDAKQAIALEDSPNGITSAKQAGLFCVAVPNALTGQLPIDHADLILSSLAALPLESLIAHAEQGRRPVTLPSENLPSRLGTEPSR